MFRVTDNTNRQAQCIDCRRIVKVINPDNGRTLPIRLIRREVEETYAVLSPGELLQLRCNRCADDPHYNIWLISLWLVGKILEIGPETYNALSLHY